MVSQEDIDVVKMALSRVDWSDYMLYDAEFTVDADGDDVSIKVINDGVGQYIWIEGIPVTSKTYTHHELDMRINFGVNQSSRLYVDRFYVSREYSVPDMVKMLNYSMTGLTRDHIAGQIYDVADSVADKEVKYEVMVMDRHILVGSVDDRRPFGYVFEFDRSTNNTPMQKYVTRAIEDAMDDLLVHAKAIWAGLYRPENMNAPIDRIMTLTQHKFIT